MRLSLDDKRKAWAISGYTAWDDGDALAFHGDQGDQRALAGGERAGKSTCVGRGELVPYLMVPHQDRVHDYHIVGDTYADARHEFSYAFEDLDGMRLVAEGKMPEHESQGWYLRTKTGCTLRTISGRDPLNIRGWGSDGIVIAEPGKCGAAVRNRCEGRLQDRGGWLIECGTFEGALQWWAKEWELGKGPNPYGLRSYSLPSYANRVAFPLGAEDPKILRLRQVYSPDEFSERVEAIPAKPRGIIFPEANHRLHIWETPYIPGVPVRINVDPGFNNPCAVVCWQDHQGVLRVFNVFYRSGLSAYQVIDHVKTEPWWRDVKGGAIDIAARAHVASQRERKSEWDIWSEYGGVHLDTNSVPVSVGIERVRSFLQLDPVLGRSRLQIDPDNGQGLLCELGLAPPPETEAEKTGPWRYKKRPDGTYTDEPEDRNNHALKALAYGLVAAFGVSRPRAAVYAPGKPVFPGLRNA